MMEKIEELQQELEALRKTNMEREKLLDQCVQLLALVRPEMHKNVLDKIGLSEEEFNGLFLEKELEEKYFEKEKK